jgi:soluble lytic murein transglycosylase-like protein
MPAIGGGYGGSGPAIRRRRNGTTVVSSNTSHTVYSPPRSSGRSSPVRTVSASTGAVTTYPSAPSGPSRRQQKVAKARSAAVSKAQKVLSKPVKVKPPKAVKPPKPLKVKVPAAKTPSPKLAAKIKAQKVISKLPSEEQLPAKLAVKFGKRYDVPASVLMSDMRQESGFNPGAVSSAGAQGLSQFIPSTAQSYGVKYGTSRKAQKTQVRGQAHYLHDLGYSKDPQAALSGYSGGYAASAYNNPVLEGAKDFKGLDKLSGTKGVSAGITPDEAVRRYGSGKVVVDSGVNVKQGDEPKLLKATHALAARLGKPVYIISGYRSPAHSVAVGGFSNDPHTQGEAMDIGVGSASRDSMHSVSEKVLNSVGLYRPFYPASASEVNHVQLVSGPLGPAHYGQTAGGSVSTGGTFTGTPGTSTSAGGSAGASGGKRHGNLAVKKARKRVFNQAVAALSKPVAAPKLTKAPKRTVAKIDLGLS